MSMSSPNICHIDSLERVLQPLLYTSVRIVAIVQGLPIVGKHVYRMYVYFIRISVYQLNARTDLVRQP
jgi:hypothetical protein